MVWGASTAFGSLTVTMPVLTPAGSPDVLSAMVKGVQTPARLLHARCTPTSAPIQVTEEVTLKFSDESPILKASTVCDAPLPPCAIDSGPTVLAESRNFGAAERKAGKRRTSGRKRLIKPTREHLFCTPRRIRRRESQGKPPLPPHRTNSSGD